MQGQQSPTTMSEEFQAFPLYISLCYKLFLKNILSSSKVIPSSEHPKNFNNAIQHYYLYKKFDLTLNIFFTDLFIEQHKDILDHF